MFKYGTVILSPNSQARQFSSSEGISVVFAPPIVVGTRSRIRRDRFAFRQGCQGKHGQASTASKGLLRALTKMMISRSRSSTFLFPFW